MSELTRAISRMLLLPAFAVAIGILVKGYSDTGDGFSAGVIAGLAILLQFVVFGQETATQLAPVRYARRCGLVGMLIALSVAFVPVLRGDPVLTHWPPPGDEVRHFGTVEMISAALFDVGVFLLVMSFCVSTVRLLAQATPRRRT